jgi:hypothetical protein
MTAARRLLFACALAALLAGQCARLLHDALTVGHGPGDGCAVSLQVDRPGHPVAGVRIPFSPPAARAPHVHETVSTSDLHASLAARIRAPPASLL